MIHSGLSVELLVLVFHSTGPILVDDW